MTFLIRKIDIFRLACTHVDIYPYPVANLRISNIYKLNIIATVSSFPNNHAVGHRHIWPHSVNFLLHSYLRPVWVGTSCTCHTHFSPSSEFLYHGIIHGCDPVHTCTFTRNICTPASKHTHTLSRKFCAPASAIILACTSVCPFFCASAFASILARAPVRVCACGGCSVCMSVVLSKS